MKESKVVQIRNRMTFAKVWIKLRLVLLQRLLKFKSILSFMKFYWILHFLQLTDNLTSYTQVLLFDWLSPERETVTLTISFRASWPLEMGQIFHYPNSSFARECQWQTTIFLRAVLSWQKRWQLAARSLNPEWMSRRRVQGGSKEGPGVMTFCGSLKLKHCESENACRKYHIWHTPPKLGSVY